MGLCCGREAGDGMPVGLQAARNSLVSMKRAACLSCWGRPCWRLTVVKWAVFARGCRLHGAGLFTQRFGYEELFRPSFRSSFCIKSFEQWKNAARPVLNSRERDVFQKNSRRCEEIDTESLGSKERCPDEIEASEGCHRLVSDSRAAWWKCRIVFNWT